jgi:hypothetical protein
MDHPLTETSSIAITSTYVVIEDYNLHPALCRFGVWVGLKREFFETYLLSYEHDPEELYVGWAVNGDTLIDPGYSAGTPPWGAPVPGVPGVSYTCPVAGLYHRISLAGTPGMEPQHLWVQVLYRYPTEYGQPFHYGPGLWVDLVGYSIAWPADKLEEWRECLHRFWELIERYLEEARVGPGDPVERWLEGLRGEEAVRLKALVETLGDLQGDEDRELREAILGELRGIAHWARSPGAPGAPAQREIEPG